MDGRDLSSTSKEQTANGFKTEEQRKSFHDEYVKQQFGGEAKYDWGEIESYMNTRDDIASIILNYL